MSIINKQSKQSKEAQYPKNFMQYKRVYVYGSVDVYRVTEEQANEIVKEFPKHFAYKPAFQTTNGQPLFYLNVSHGKQHLIFSIPV